MRSFFGVIFVFLAVVFICTTIFAGFRALCLRIIDKIKADFQKYRVDSDVSPRYNIRKENTNKRSVMKVISLTTGKCDTCGRTFIGTTGDEECPLQEIEFMGDRRILCSDCLVKLMQDFKKSGQSDERWFSKNARHLRDLLSDCINKEK